MAGIREMNSLIYIMIAFLPRLPQKKSPFTRLKGLVHFVCINWWIVFLKKLQQICLKLWISHIYNLIDLLYKVVWSSKASRYRALSYTGLADICSVSRYTIFKWVQKHLIYTDFSCKNLACIHSIVSCKVFSEPKNRAFQDLTVTKNR